MTSTTLPEPAELVARLRRIGQMKADDNKRVGRRGKEWAVETELEWQAADALASMQARLSAAEAKVVELEARLAPKPAIKALRAGHDFPCAYHPGPRGDCNEQNCRCN